jgi:hypothetical protein
VTKRGVTVWLLVGSALSFVVGLLGQTTVALVTTTVATVGGSALAILVGQQAVQGVRGRTWEDARSVKAYLLIPLLSALFGWAVVRGQELGGRDALLDLEITGSTRTLWPWQAIAVDLMVFAFVVALSSLIDWCVTKPRMCGNGQAEKLPCRTSTDQGWGFVTRLWVGHRTIATIVGRLLLLAALLFIAYGIFRPTIHQPTVAAIGAVAAAVLGVVLNRLAPVISLVLNPPMQVGDKVVLAEEHGTGVTWRPVYYVVDVAFEGVKLLELERHRDVPTRRRSERKHDRSLSLDNVARLLRSRDRFTGCDRACQGVNPHCPFTRDEPIPVVAKDTPSQ